MEYIHKGVFRVVEPLRDRENSSAALTLAQNTTKYSQCNLNRWYIEENCQSQSALAYIPFLGILKILQNALAYHGQILGQHENQRFVYKKKWTFFQTMISRM